MHCVVEYQVFVWGSQTCWHGSQWNIMEIPIVKLSNDSWMSVFLQFFWWSSSLPSSTYACFQLDWGSSLLLVGFLSQIKSSLLLLLQAVTRCWWKKSISEKAWDSAGAGFKRGKRSWGSKRKNLSINWRSPGMKPMCLEKQDEMENMCAEKAHAG